MESSPADWSIANGVHGLIVATEGQAVPMPLGLAIGLVSRGSQLSMGLEVKEVFQRR